jgi:perosamine synthetase
MQSKLDLSFGRHEITQEDIDAVVDVLRSKFLTQGPTIESFESKLASTCGAKYAVAVANGTAALHLAYIAAGACPDTEVMTSPITFAATSNAAYYVGAAPVFVDIDLRTFNMDLNRLEEALRKSRAKKKMIVPVHFAGVACELDEIEVLAEKYDALVVEDASHALGASYKNKSIGGTHDRHMATFSFHPVKHVTCAEGGAVVTNDEGYYKKLKLLRTHGISKHDFEYPQENLGPWYQEMQLLGFNYRLSEINAALGLSQLKRVEKNVRRRSEIAALYQDILAEKTDDIILPLLEHANCKSSWLLYVIQIEYEKIGLTRSEYMKRLSAQGIHTQVHQIPVYRHPYYRRQMGDLSAHFPNAETYYRRALSIPMYSSLTDSDVHGVVEICTNALKN